MIPEWWLEIENDVRIEKYGNRGKEQARIEVTSRRPSLMEVEGQCAACRKAFRPVVARQGYAIQPYVRVTCGGVACVRSDAAREASSDLLEYLRTGEEPTRAKQVRLFD